MKKPTVRLNQLESNANLLVYYEGNLYDGEHMTVKQFEDSWDKIRTLQKLSVWTARQYAPKPDILQALKSALQYEDLPNDGIEDVLRRLTGSDLETIQAIIDRIIGSDIGYLPDTQVLID